MGEVTNICKRTLTSTRAGEKGRIIPLSPLDRVMERHHIHIVYYYATPPQSLDVHDHDQVEFGSGRDRMLTSKLRVAMSEMLIYFPHITGRLVRDEKGKWSIKCNDAGIRMVEAKAKGSVEKWLENVDDEKEKMLVHWEDMFHIPYFWATLYTKVTEFEEGGLAVGLSCTHLLADPLCATLLIKAWADRTLLGKMIHPPLFHPLAQQRLGYKSPQPKPKSDLIDRYKTILESPSPSATRKFKTVAIEFMDTMVQACMNLVQSNGLDPSPFSSIVGLLWVCISRVKGVTNGLIDMSICLDVRGVLGLDKGFFGNCMVYKKVHGDGIGVDDHSQATRAIGEAIEKGNNKEIMDLVYELERCEHHSPSPSLDNGDLIAVNLENMDPYSATFIKNFDPIRVSYYIEPNVDQGKILVLPPRPCKGKLSRVVMVTLPTDEVVKLCEDKFLARFSPTILMHAMLIEIIIVIMCEEKYPQLFRTSINHLSFVLS